MTNESNNNAMGKFLKRYIEEMLNAQRQSMRSQKDSWMIYSNMGWRGELNSKRDSFIRQALNASKAKTLEEDAFKAEMTAMVKRFLIKHGAYKEIMAHIHNNQAKLFKSVSMSLGLFPINELPRYMKAYICLNSQYGTVPCAASKETWEHIHKAWEDMIFELARKISRKRKGRKQAKDCIITRLSAHFRRHEDKHEQESQFSKLKGKTVPSSFYGTISSVMPNDSPQYTHLIRGVDYTRQSGGFLPYAPNYRSIFSRMLKA